MSSKIKTHLIKTLTLPVIDYSTVPIHVLSKNQLSILQRVQDKALRFAFHQRYPYTLTTGQVHIFAKIESVNTRLHKRAVQTWEKFLTLNIPLYTTLTQNTEKIENTTLIFRAVSKYLIPLHQNICFTKYIYTETHISTHT